VNLHKKIITNSFWILFDNAIGRMAMFVTSIIAARILSQELFGKFSMIRSTVTMIGNFFSGAIATSATKSIAEYKHKNSDMLYNAILAIFILNSSILFFAIIFIVIFSDAIIDYFFLGQRDLISALYMATGILVTASFSTIIQGVLTGFEKFKKISLISLPVSIISIPLIILMIYKFELKGAILGVAFYFGLDFISKAVYLKYYLLSPADYANWFLIKSAFNKILRLTMPLFLAIIVNAIAFWYSRILIINRTQQFDSIAIFDAAYQWLTIIMVVTGAISNVMLPMLVKATGGYDKSQVKKIFLYNVIINFTIAISIAVLFIIFAKNIMLIYGDTYVKGSSILIVLSITSVVFTLSTVFSNFMLSHNKSFTILAASVSGVIVMYILLGMLKGQQLINLAWSFFGYYCTTVVYYFIFSLKHLKYS